MGVTIGGDAAKNDKNTHLLVIMHMRLSQKIGLLDLTDRTRFEKGNGYKIRTKSVRDYWGTYAVYSLLAHQCWPPGVVSLGCVLRVCPGGVNASEAVFATWRIGLDSKKETARNNIRKVFTTTITRRKEALECPHTRATRQPLWIWLWWCAG